MLFKLSLRNVKRSMKDYGVYFFTLALGVCIFYIFNSLESQTVMMEMSDMQKQGVEAITHVLSMVSGFVSFILGFLVLYANNFMINRRNKEFGVYMTLGISRNKIAFMLFYETLLVGIISLITGLFIGVFLSQGIAGITARSFLMDMKEYQFVFSSEACIKTSIYFSIMYIVAMVLNFIVVSRANITVLITGSKKNEKIKSTNLILSVVLFIVSIVCLAVAYKLILENQLVDLTDEKFRYSIILGILGTFLFFRALAGFLIKVIQSSKNTYLKGLNAFTLRQLNSRVNTNYISISVICLMLFVAIGMSAAGFGIKRAMEASSEFNTPYDMTFVQDMNKSSEIEIKKALDEKGFIIEDYAKDYIEYNSYKSPLTFKEMFKDTDDDFLSEQIKFMTDFNISVIKLSDYNKLTEYQDKEKISLRDNEVSLLTNVEKMKESIEIFIKSNDTVKIDDKNYEINEECIYQTIETTVQGSDFLTIVMNDEDIVDYPLNKHYLSLNYKGNKKETEEDVMDYMMSIMEENKNPESESEFYISTMTKILAIEANMVSSNLFLYVGIYVGLVFLISSAAVLALSQLSSATESIERYEALRKLGVGSKMINKSIFIQVLLYFFLPLGLALVHSIYGLKVTNNFIKVFGGTDVTQNSIYCILIIIIIYGVYFLGTYKGYKRIVNK